ncbi:MAG: tyrosine-type recombinase/integrase, partial [Nanoarchaeota archaeon]
MNKDIIEKLFPDVLRHIEAGRCPICGEKIKPEEFRTELDVKEHKISGMCMACQQKVFKESMPLYKSSAIMGEEKYSEKQQNKMKNQKRTISFLEKKEVEKIITTIKPEGSRNLRDRALIEVLFSTGLRISEALALVSMEMIPLLDEKGTSEFPIIGKGGWQRVIYFSPRAKQAIEVWLRLKLKIENRVFPEEHALLFPITSRCAQKMVIERAKVLLKKMMENTM